MTDLKEKVIAYNKELKETIITILGELNKGQRKKLLNNETVKALLDRYKITIEE